MNPVVNHEPILGLLEWLVEQPKTPSQLKFRHLVINQEGFLASVRNHQKKDFNFHALEQLAFDCSKENLKLYNHLIKKSHLVDLPHARFYREVILKGLYLEEVNLKEFINFFCDTSSIPRDIIEIFDIEYAKRVYLEARKMAKEARESLLTFEQKHPKQFHDVWKEAAYIWCNEHCQAGRLWPNFKLEIAIMIGNSLKSGSLQ
jgi:hypothetical protein